MLTVASTLTARFAWMIEWACKLTAAEAHKRRLDGPLAAAMWNRLRRAGKRFASLYAKWKAGTLPAPHVRPPSARPAAPNPPGVLRRFNWFRKLLPQTAPPLAGTLLDLLYNDPEMAALVAAAPQAGRILRPMCWMVGIKPPEYLRLPRRPRKPRGAVRCQRYPALRTATLHRRLRPCPQKGMNKRQAHRGRGQAGCHSPAGCIGMGLGSDGPEKAGGGASFLFLSSNKTLAATSRLSAQ